MVIVSEFQNMGSTSTGQLQIFSAAMYMYIQQGRFLVQLSMILTVKYVDDVLNTVTVQTSLLLSASALSHMKLLPPAVSRI